MKLYLKILYADGWVRQIFEPQLVKQKNNFNRN